MRWLDSITDSMNLSKLWEISEDRGAWRATIYRVTRVRHNLETEKQHLLILIVFESLNSGCYKFCIYGRNIHS